MGKLAKSTKKFLKKNLKKPAAVKKSKKHSQKSDKEKVEDQESESEEEVVEEQVIVIHSSEDDDEGDDDIESLQEDDEDSEESESVPDMELNMKELQEKDPEFYKYLLENDKELLDFNQNDSEEDEETLTSFENIVTKEMIHQWRASLEKNQSVKVLKKVVMAFKAASCFGEDEEETATTKYKIVDEKVFNVVILTAIKYTPVVLNGFLYSGKKISLTLCRWSKIDTTFHTKKVEKSLFNCKIIFVVAFENFAKNDFPVNDKICSQDF